MSQIKGLKGFIELPPALAGGIKVELEKALAKFVVVWLKPFKLNYFPIQLMLDATFK
ncbi:hypothetical protein AAYQ05_05890 [Flavobacterium sp. B11]|uniref:hypothetical protein n=1 Tax=Flavobacterium movens TaxID=214860 RepID=UPI0031D969FA